MDKLTKKKGCLILIFIFVFFVVTIFVIYRFFLREHWYWQVDLNLSNQDKIRILFDSNCRKTFFSFPGRHPSIIIGGGDLRFDIFFNYRGEDFHFRTSKLIVLINFYKGEFFIVTLGTIEKNSYKRKFYFYRYSKTKKWEIIKKSDFPKSIALPNVYYTLNYPLSREVSEYDEINPLKKDFRYSITAKLWFVLEKKIEYYELGGKNLDPYEVSKDFLITYKKKHIDPYWKEEELKLNKPIVVSVKQKD